MVAISGGNKLAAALAEIAQNVSKSSSVQIGFLEGSTYKDGTSVPMVAAIQEFGAPSRGIPPRPFFRNMIAKNSPDWPELIAENLKANDYDGSKTLDQVGAEIKGELKQSITDTNSPALSPITVMLRGMRGQAKYQGMAFGKLIAEARARVADGKTNYGASTKPLVDTGEMQSVVDYVVK